MIRRSTAVWQGEAQARRIARQQPVFNGPRIAPQRRYLVMALGAHRVANVSPRGANAVAMIVGPVTRRPPRNNARRRQSRYGLRLR